MRKLFLLFFFLACAGISSAQEMFGIVNSNYAGNNAWKFNPAFLADSRLKWDINIVSLEVYARNDYVYVPKGSLTLFKLADGKQGEIGSFDKYNQPPKNAYVTSNLLLPSFMISRKSHTFGFHIGARSYVNANKVPFHIAKFFFDGLDFEDQHNFDYSAKYFSVASAGWLEYGISYSGVISNYRRHYFSWGVNINFIKGLAGVYYVNQDLQYRVPNADTIYVQSVTSELGNSYSTTESKFPGKGTGFDIGFSYERKREYQWTSVYRKSLIQTYDFKFGLALLDFGKITFSDNSAVVKVDAKSDTMPASHLKGIKTGYVLDTTINSDFNQNNIQPLASFQMSLPTALSLTFDRNISDYWYWNISMIYNLTNYGKDLTRMKQLCFSLRYESKWFELGLPLTFYNVEKPQVGFAFRFHSFFIGSDNILPLMGIGKIYSSSFYFGIKISAFKERWSMKDKSMYLNTRGGILSPFSGKRRRH